MADPILAAVNPVDIPDAYDQFKLAGQWSPGICHFDPPPKRLTGWDIQVPSGGSGGFTILKKAPPITFTVKIFLWKGDDELGGDVDHFATWETFKKVLATIIKRNDKKALEIYHPLLAGLQPPVTSVVHASASEPAPDGQGGAWVEIVFDEYRPLIIKPIKPLNGSALDISDPNAQRKAFLDYEMGAAQNAASRTFEYLDSFEKWKANGAPLQWTGHGAGEHT